MNPPAHAVLLSIDEESQIQALDPPSRSRIRQVKESRIQPGLPLKPSKCGTVTHDYRRRDTTTLFAALNVLDGAGGIATRYSGGYTP
jgi:hypothetical protein